MKITDFFLQRKKLTYLLMIFIIIAGIFSMSSLPRQDSPNVNFNILTIRTFYPGSSPLDVEINITDLIEDELEQVDGIDEMSSFSIEGMSVIFIKIDPDFSDAERVKTDIRSAVDRVSNLPKEVKNRPIVEEMKSTDFPVLEVAIIGKNVGEDMLRKIARDMEYEIKSVSKVGTINKIGYRKKEVKILCDNREMSKRYVSFVEILRAIGARNVKLTGGTLESFADEKNIVTFSEFEDVLSVKDVIIRSNFSGEHIKVSDIAEVKLGHEKRKIISRTNGFNSINLLVKRRGTTDVIDLSKEIDKVIEKYQKTYKEKGVDIVKVVDFTYYTKSLLNIVTNNALLGFCLVLVSLFVFLNFYTAIWVAVGIPLSILAAYMFFPLFDITTNQITLITIIIVLGMLVDDAIVIAENINRHQEAGVDGYNAALIGTREVFKPVLATILTTIFCFVPMYFMKGIVGKFVFAIPTVVILILVMSFFESITLLPVHLSGRNGALSSKKEKWLNAVRTNYGRLLKFFLRHRKTTFAGFFLWAAIAGGIFGYYGKIELFPTSDFDLFYIVMELPTGTSLHETSGKVGDVEKIVATIPDKLMMGYKTVIGEHRTDEAAANPALHENWALITIYLHPAAKRDVRSEAIIEDLKEKTVALNGFTKLDVREIQDGPPVGKPITIRLVSDDFKLCEKFERGIMDYIKSLDGTYDLETTNQSGKKEIRLKLKHEYMAQLGVTAMELADTIRVAYDGNVATSIRRDGEEIDFRVQLKKEQRNDLEVLKELQLLNRQNKLVKIKKFVTFHEGVADQSITHYKGKKSISITGHVKSEVITSMEVNQLIREKFAEEIGRTPGITMEFGGKEKESMKSMENFFRAFTIALLGVYFILVILFNSFIQPFLIMIAIPFGFVGVLIAFWIHGLPISFIGMIGTLGMIGVVVNDSLVMVTYLNNLRKKHNKMNMDLILEGAKTRLRPVLLTTITTVLGLLPTVYGWGGHEPFLVPMVLAMSWGLALATFVTLILVPVLYSFVVRE